MNDCSSPPGWRPRLVNLLDDFNLGGVSRALGIFESEVLRAGVRSSIVAVRPDTLLAEHYDADIIVLHFPPNWRRLAYVASLRLRNPQACLIWVEHSYTAAWARAKVRRRRRFGLLLKLAYRLATRIVSVSEGQAAWLRAGIGRAAGRVEVIHPYTENPGLALLAPPLRQPGAPLRIGAYGRFCEQKGLDNLIRAHRAGWMAGTELVIGGFGEEEALLRGLAGDAPDIHFYGKVTQVAEFLASCDCVAVPSRWEAYGMVANEAREAARPILVAPVDGLPEQVGAAGLIVDFTDRASVEAACAQLQEADLAAMGLAGRAATRGCAERRAGRWAQLLAGLPLVRRPGHGLAAVAAG
ncbi:MAG TPA: glycosyltransferase family 4 protein [Novosphingobium sp.]|nr:glycosyltransferase family 4 protein [Novosphingobium sp.]HZV09305.1 glycosyltransferase family 4 protein [Novosphingobium sp.]